MPDLNDVVRHVILRIVVDQGRLADDLAAARTKLKAFEQAEKDSNKNRRKDADSVTNAILAQNRALDENARAHDSARRSATGTSNTVADQHKAATAAIKEETKALGDTQIAEAKADAVRRKTAQDAEIASEKLRRTREKNEQDFRNELLKTAALQRTLRDAELKRATALDAAQSRSAASQALDEHSINIGGSKARSEAARAGSNEVRFADTEDAAAVAWDRRRSAARNAERIEKLQIQKLTQAVRREEEAATVAAERRAASLRKERGLWSEFREIAQHVARAGAEAVPSRPGRLRQAVGAFDKTFLERGGDITRMEGRRDQNATVAGLRSFLKDLTSFKPPTFTPDPETRRRRTQPGVDKDLRTLFTDTGAQIGKAAADAARREAQRVSYPSGYGTPAARREAERISGPDRQPRERPALADTVGRRAVDEFNRAETIAERVRRGAAKAHQELKALGDSTSLLGRYRGVFEGFSNGIRGIHGEAAKLQASSSTIRAFGNAVTAAFGSGSSGGGVFERWGRGAKGARSELSQLNSVGGSSLTRLKTALSAFGSGSSETFDRVRTRVRAMSRELSGLSGSGLSARLRESFSGLGTGIEDTVKNLSKHLLSFRTLILATIASLGPLGASLGAVGAAALGLAADLGSLTGVLFALPGLISAAAGAFGVMAAIMGPLTNVFSAYKAVSDANTKSSKAHTDAVTDEAQAQEKLNEARKTAARRIQDYRFALQKLKYDEEGAQLGVENAEQNLRRVLADPSATALDRKNALHAVEGAKFDRAQQQIDTGRTKEDAADAERKGVEGSDEVVAALQAVATATKNLKAGSQAAADAQDKLDAALGKLGPKTRELIEKGIKPLSGEWTKLQKNLEDDVFGPLLPDVDKFKGLLESLRSFIEPTAKAMGELAHEAVTMLSSPEWKSFFSEQGEENAKTVKTLGRSLLNLADAFKGIIMAARPFTEWLTGAFERLTKSFSDWANSAEGKSSIGTFLDDTKKRIQELWPVIKNIASGIAGFWTALTQTGGADENFTTKINKGLLGMSETFAELGKKASDPEGGFQKWLKRVGPLLHDVAKAVGALGGFLGHLFSDQENMEEASRILKSLTETVLPKLAELFEHLSASGMMSKIFEGVGKFLNALDSFLDSGGTTALKAIFSTLSLIASAVDFLATRVPGLTTALAGLAIVFGTLAAASVVIRMLRLLEAARGLASVFKFFRGAPAAGGIGAALKNVVTGKVDDAKDTVLNKDKGVSAAERDARNSKNTGSVKPTPDLSGTGGTVEHLTRIERQLMAIHSTIKACCGKGGVGGSGTTSKDERDHRNRTTTGTTAERQPRPTGIRGRTTGIVSAATVTGATITAGGRSIRDVVEGVGTPGTGSVTSTRPAVPVTTVGTTLAEQRRDAVQASRRDRTTGGTAIGNNERTADRAIRRPFDIVSSGPLRTGARPSTTDFDIVDTVDDQRARRARRGALGQPALEAPQTRRQLTAGPSATQPALASRRQRSLTAGPDRPDTGFDTVQDQRNRRTDFDIVESADERRPRPELPSATRPELPAGSVPAPRDTGGRFRPVEEGEARPNPQRGSGGQFSSTEKPAKPSLVNTGTDYNVYTGDDGRPITETGDKPRKRRYTNVGSDVVKSFTEPTSAMRANAETRSRADRITAVAEARERRLRDGTGVGRNESAARLAIEEDARRGTGRRGRLRGLGSRIVDFLKPPSDDSGSIPVESRARRARSTVAADDLDDLRDPLSGTSREDRRRRMSTDLADADTLTDAKNRRGIDVDDDTAPRRRRFNLGRGRGAGALAEEVAESATRGGRLGRVAGTAGRVLGKFGGGAGRLAGGLARGLGGGLAGLALSGAMQFGGDYLLDKFVKNDEDKGSLSRGLGAVSTGAGIGATIGSFVPGIGTAIGAGIGGLAGGAYSLYKDKNLRSFLGDKVSGAWDATKNAVGGALGTAKDAVGGAASAAWGGIKNAGSAVKDIFTGGGGGPAAMALGPIGGLLAKTDIGKSIFDSLNKAGGKIGDFFTKTIPDWFNKGVAGITRFFTTTLPSLPGKAFDAFFTAVGRVGAFFTKDIPRYAAAAGHAIERGFVRAFDMFFHAIGRIAAFFVKDIPRFASSVGRLISRGFNTAFDTFFFAVGRVGAFFTKDLPQFATAAAQRVIRGFERIGHFFTDTLPALVSTFFTETIPRLAGQAWTFIQSNLWDPFVGFIKSIPGFFTETIPHWFETANKWLGEHVTKPVVTFITETVPNFFTETIPKWFEALPGVLDEHVVQPISKFFGTTVPDFFIKDIPAAISKLPGFLYSNLVQPILDFFGGIADHIGDFLKGSWEWAKGLFNRASSDVQAGYNAGEAKGKMSGGLIEGVYQGIEDTAKIWATPGEFMVRRSKVDQYQGKRFLNDYNEGRIDPARFYAGLAQTSAPNAMSIVPPVSGVTGQVPAVVNHQVDNSLSYGDVHIHNPYREKSEYSLRRQLQIANTRHRGRG